jgi:hypothetical protein
MFRDWSTLRWVSFGLVAASLLAWIIWDIIAVVRDKRKGNSPSKGATISEVTMGTLRRFPIIGVLIGVVLGHLFWPQIPADVEDCKEVCQVCVAKKSD